MLHTKSLALNIASHVGVSSGNKPRRVCRRLIVISYAVMSHLARGIYNFGPDIPKQFQCDSVSVRVAFEATVNDHRARKCLRTE